MTAQVSNKKITSYIASAHPYVFDGLFISAERWTGAGYVIVRDKGGGAHEAWALVEADRAGYEAIEKAGFAVRSATRQRHAAGRAPVVCEDGSAVSRREDRVENP
jgi:hypothetical protein